MSRGKNFYKVTIESGVEGPGQNERIFIIDEEDDELLWMLLRRIRVRPESWTAQQKERRDEEIRRIAEQQRKAREARERAQNYTYQTYFNQSSFDDFARAFRGGYDDGFRFNQAPNPGSTRTRPTLKSHKMLLAEMAVVEWAVAELMDDMKLLRRAQRKCHPDTGGSHEKWVKLEKIQREMGL
jgi:hypothetical protein